MANLFCRKGLRSGLMISPCWPLFLMGSGLSGFSALFFIAGREVSIGLTLWSFIFEKRQSESLRLAYWLIKESFALFLVGIKSSAWFSFSKCCENLTGLTSTRLKDRTGLPLSWNPLTGLFSGLLAGLKLLLGLLSPALSQLLRIMFLIALLNSG